MSCLVAIAPSDPGTQNVPPAPKAPAPNVPLLDELRAARSAARCQSYVDLFGACAALSSNRHVARHSAAEILMRGLEQALQKRPILYRVGEAQTSFDEDWLLALARSLQTNDTQSAAFLLFSRVPRQFHRNLVFLMRGLVEHFPRV